MLESRREWVSEQVSEQVSESVQSNIIFTYFFPSSVLRKDEAKKRNVNQMLYEWDHFSHIKLVWSMETNS